MKEILQDAIAGYATFASTRSWKARRIYRKARRWVESTDRVWGLSFERVCAALGLDADYLRETLRASNG